MSISKSESRKRLFIDMAVNNIVKIKNQIDAYEKCMSEEAFSESKEVAELYKQLNDLIKQDY